MSNYESYESEAVDAQGATLNVSEDDGANYVEIKEVNKFGAVGAGTASVKDVTHLKSKAKEKRLGLKDEGDIAISGNYIAKDPGQKILEKNSSKNKVLKMKIEFADKKTDAGSGTTMDFDFLVNPFAPDGAEVDGVLAFNATLVITGEVDKTEAS